MHVVICGRGHLLWPCTIQSKIVWKLAIDDDRLSLTRDIAAGTRDRRGRSCCDVLGSLQVHETEAAIGLLQYVDGLKIAIDEARVMHDQQDVGELLSPPKNLFRLR